MNISVTKIEIRMAALGLTQKELAQNCGVSKRTISRAFRLGLCEPRTAGKLATGLGVPVTAIIPEGVSK